ncbi:MAG: hypothetical protein MAG451_02085 [Anaerolineales bacterium]|nr:hypothetical protein [Anaerolineales bacterium]
MCKIITQYALNVSLRTSSSVCFLVAFAACVLKIV